MQNPREEFPHLSEHVGEYGVGFHLDKARRTERLRSVRFLLSRNGVRVHTYVFGIAELPSRLDVFDGERMVVESPAWRVVE